MLDDQTDLAIYGHVHKQLLRYGSQGQQILNPGLLACLIFDWGTNKPQSSVCANRCRSRWGDQPAIS